MSLYFSVCHHFHYKTRRIFKFNSAIKSVLDLKHALRVLCLGSYFSSKNKCLSSFLPPLKQYLWLKNYFSTSGQTALARVLCLEKSFVPWKNSGLARSVCHSLWSSAWEVKRAVTLLSRIVFFVALCGTVWEEGELYRASSLSYTLWMWGSK